MAMTDPLADMLTRMRNAILVKKEEVTFSSSSLKREVLSVLKKNGFVGEYREETKENKKYLTLKLRVDEEYKISSLKRISKPGRRVYAKKGELPKVLGGLGMLVVSTPKGVMSGKDARKQGVGGELILEVY